MQSTQQITKAMKMVSAAKLRRAQDAITQMRPYARKLQELLGNIIGSSESPEGMALAAERPVERVLLIVVTSDRGLAGAYNANLIKQAKQLIREQYPTQYRNGNVTIWSIGKKGYEHFIKNNYKVSDTHKDIFLNLTFEAVQRTSVAALQAFQNQEFDAVELVYSEFRNAATQRFVTERFLPIAKTVHTGSKVQADFIFDPNKEELIAELMPKILNTQLFKAVLDAHASEHGARMTAMDKASENANELLRNLKISYNRARQAAITTELTEIVSGAAALKG